MIKCSDWIVVHCGRLMRQEVEKEQDELECIFYILFTWVSINYFIYIFV